MIIEKNRLLWHILLWGSTWLLLSIYLGRGWEDPLRILYGSIPTLLSILLLISINLQFLLPKFYFRKKVVLYFIISLTLFVVLIWLLNNNFFLFSELAEKYNSPEMIAERRQKINPIPWLRYFVPLLISFVGSTLIELTHFANKKEKTIISIEKEKLDTEIKFLKSQINPHFLFNVLNNIYTLTVIKSDQAPDNLLRLSDMLRYMLYDSNEGKVPLKKEVSYLKNYIDLASLKDSRGLNIKVDLDESQPNLAVAPLLLIPFVENAFKHSKIEDLKNGYINIHLKTSEEHLEFFIENSIPKVLFSKDKVGGIGLTNTKQRLDLLYPDKHILEISNDGETYSIYLKLDLK